jgi:hypothetical protein
VVARNARAEAGHAPSPTRSDDNPAANGRADHLRAAETTAAEPATSNTGAASAPEAAAPTAPSFSIAEEERRARDKSDHS